MSAGEVGNAVGAAVGSAVGAIAGEAVGEAVGDAVSGDSGDGGDGGDGEGDGGGDQPLAVVARAGLAEARGTHSSNHTMSRFLAEPQSPAAAPFAVAIGFNHFDGSSGLLTLLAAGGFVIDAT